MSYVNDNNFVRWSASLPSETCYYALPLVEGDDIKIMFNYSLDDNTVPFSTLKVGLWDNDGSRLYLEDIATLNQVVISGDLYSVYFEWTVPVLAKNNYRFVLYKPDDFAYADAVEKTIAKPGSNAFIDAGASGDNFIAISETGFTDDLDYISGFNLNIRNIMVHVKEGHTITFIHEKGTSYDFTLLSGSDTVVSGGDRIYFEGSLNTFTQVADTFQATYYYYSNLFTTKPNSNYTGLVKYRNAVDALDYTYTSASSFYNQIRVDLWTGRPEPVENMIGYQTYVNDTIRTRTSINKKIEFETRFLDEGAHVAFFAMLAQSEFYIDGIRYKKAEGDEYAITWSEFDDEKIGNGSVKLMVFDYSEAINLC